MKNFVWLVKMTQGLKYKLLSSYNRFRSLYQLKSNCCSVCFSVFTDYATRRANRMASKWSYKPKDQNLSYQGKFQ